MQQTRLAVGAGIAAVIAAASLLGGIFQASTPAAAVPPGAAAERLSLGFAAGDTAALVAAPPGRRPGAAGRRAFTRSARPRLPAAGP